MRPFTTSRMITVRLSPPRLPGGINGSTRDYLPFVVGEVAGIARKWLRSYRARFSFIHIGGPSKIRPPLLNHK